jgi:hypothetical protein
MKILAGAWAGALLAVAPCIAWNTSANVGIAASQGQHREMHFRAAVISGGLGALVGVIVVAIVLAAAAGARAASDIRRNAFEE